MIIGYGPSRYSVSQLLQENVFPLWRAYVSGGIPNYTGFISAWSPLILMTAWLGNYTILTLHFFFILYIFIAGLGIFKLVDKLIGDRKIAFIAGVSYMLSGVMVSNAQHMDIIAGTAWLPWVVFSYYCLSRQLKFQYILQFSAVTYLLITDGYPAITIFTAYFIIAIGVYETIRHWKNRNNQLNRFIIFNIATLFLILLLGSGLILAFTDIAPEVARFQKVDFAKSNASSFTYQSFISFITPYASIGDYWFFNSDISMINAYFGIFLFFAAIMGVFYKLPKMAWFFLTSAIIWLWAALGDTFYLRHFFFEYVPGMNKFRFPALFRIPAMFSLIVFSAFAIKAITDKKQLLKFKRGILLYAGLFISIAIIAAFQIDFENFVWFSNKKDSQLSARVFIQISIHLILIGVFIWLIFKRKKNIVKSLIWLVPLDLIIAVQLNMHHTVVSEVDPINYYKQQISHPRGFPIPSTNKIIQNTDPLFSFGPSWLNGSLFAKEVNHNGYNALLLDKYRQINADEDLKNNTLNNPLVYLSADLRPLSKRWSNENISNKTLFANDSALKEVLREPLSHAETDTLFITEFRPGYVDIHVKSAEKQVLTLLQSYFKGWTVCIDNVEADVLNTNYQFMSVIVPAGVHNVTFKFENSIIRTLSLMNLFITIAIFLFLILINHKKYKRSTKIAMYLVMAILSILVIIRLFGSTYSAKRMVAYEKINNLKNTWAQNLPSDSITTLLNIDHHALANKLSPPLTESKGLNSPARYYTTGAVSRLANYLDTAKKTYLFYVWSNTKTPDELYGAILYDYPLTIKKESFGETTVMLLKRNKQTIGKNNMTLNYEPDQKKQNTTPYDSTRAIDGKFSYKMSPNVLYGGGTILKKNEHFNDSLNYLFIRSYCFIEEPVNSSLIVKFFAQNEDKPLFTKSIPLSQDKKSFNHWSPVILTSSIPEKTETIQIFFYKPDKSKTIWVDKTEIRTMNKSKFFRE